MIVAERYCIEITLTGERVSVVIFQLDAKPTLRGLIKVPILKERAAVLPEYSAVKLKLEVELETKAPEQLPLQVFPVDARVTSKGKSIWTVKLPE
jgi:hypothetical protein